MPAGLVEGLATEDVYVAARLGRMRISPHVFNDEDDTDRFVAALARRARTNEHAVAPFTGNTVQQGMHHGICR